MAIVYINSATPLKALYRCSKRSGPQHAVVRPPARGRRGAQDPSSSGSITSLSASMLREPAKTSPFTTRVGVELT